jgi:hypothetical protein
MPVPLGSSRGAPEERVSEMGGLWFWNGRATGFFERVLYINSKCDTHLGALPSPIEFPPKERERERESPSSKRQLPQTAH